MKFNAGIFLQEIAHESAIDIEYPSWAYLAGHKIDKVTVMPASDILCGLWNQLADIFGRDYKSFSLQFKNVMFNRAFWTSVKKML